VERIPEETNSYVSSPDFAALLLALEDIFGANIAARRFGFGCSIGMVLGG
jgi:hypothetical protein